MPLSHFLIVDWTNVGPLPSTTHLGISNRCTNRYWRRLRWLAEMTISCNEINTRHPQGTEGGDAQLELVKTEVWGANYAFLRQKMANFGTSSGAVLCHGDCHIGTKLSCDTLKMSECVQKTFCEVL